MTHDWTFSSHAMCPWSSHAAPVVIDIYFQEGYRLIRRKSSRLKQPNLKWSLKIENLHFHQNYLILSTHQCSFIRFLRWSPLWKNLCLNSTGATFSNIWFRDFTHFIIESALFSFCGKNRFFKDMFFFPRFNLPNIFFQLHTFDVVLKFWRNYINI